MYPKYQFYTWKNWKIFSPEGVNMRWLKIQLLRKWPFWAKNSYYKLFKPVLDCFGQTRSCINMRWPKIQLLRKWPFWAKNSYYKLFKPVLDCFGQTRSCIIPFRTAVPAEGTYKHCIILRSMANYNNRRKLPILPKMVRADS